MFVLSSTGTFLLRAGCVQMEMEGASAAILQISSRFGSQLQSRISCMLEERARTSIYGTLRHSVTIFAPAMRNTIGIDMSGSTTSAPPYSHHISSTMQQPPYHHHQSATSTDISLFLTAYIEQVEQAKASSSKIEAELKDLKSTLKNIEDARPSTSSPSTTLLPLAPRLAEPSTR